MAKYISKVGDRVSTVAFCRGAALSQKSLENQKNPYFQGYDKDCLKLRRCLQKRGHRSGQEIQMPNVKRDELKLALMDFDEEGERYKQVKSVNGGGTRHLSIDKNETVADIKVMAENLFFPQRSFKKQNKSLSHYSTHIESSQIHVDVSNTVYELYNESKVKILRLYLCTKKKMGQQLPVGVEGNHGTSHHSVVDFTDNEHHRAVEDENRN